MALARSAKPPVAADPADSGHFDSGSPPDSPWFCGGGGGAGAPAFARAQEPELAPPLKAAALILSSCFHFLVLFHVLRCSVQLASAQALRAFPIDSKPANPIPAIHPLLHLESEFVSRGIGK
jgi:hypothetical protein